MLTRILFTISIVLGTCSFAFAGDSDIISAFKHSGDIASNAKIEAIIKPKESAHADRVIFIDVDGKRKYAAKVFAVLGSYETETANFDEDKKLVASINHEFAESKIKMPILVDYVAHKIVDGEGVVLLTAAEGRRLDHLLNEIDNFDDEVIIKIFTNMGLQLGNMDSFLAKKEKSLPHPDSQLRNFMYDDKQDQLYWLDLNELKLKKLISSNAPDFDTFYKNNPPFVNEIVLPMFGKKYHIEFIGSEKWSSYGDYIADEDVKENDIKQAVKKVRKIILAFQSLYKGYSDGVKHFFPEKYIMQANEYGIFIEQLMKKYTIKDLYNEINKALKERGIDLVL